jgi:hypothetical protein
LKREVVKKAKELLDQGFSLRKTAAFFEYQHLYLSAIQLSKWIKSEERMNLANAATGLPKSSHALSLHPGKLSTIHNISAELLEWIIQNREMGMPVSRNMVILKASSLDETFRRRSADSKYKIICRFNANNLVIHSKMHQAQKTRYAMEEIGRDFIASMVPRLVEAGRDQRFIINMDQTPVFFSMTPKTTLQVRGSKTVSVRVSSDSTKRITVAVTVTASGSMLPPYLTFNAKPSGRVERGLVNFPTGAHYAVQQNAWMDERVMLLWVNEVLEPYVKTAPDGVRPLP